MNQLIHRNIEITSTENYVEDIRHILQQARKLTRRSINHIMVEAYWMIGERIVRQEQHGKERAAYGEAVLKELSRSLSQELGSGFSYANLRNMRQFYLTYPDYEICYTVCSKLLWSHNRLIMRVQDDAARKFYLKECIENQWSVPVMNDSPQLFASKYLPYLPTEQELKQELETKYKLIEERNNETEI